MSNDINVNTQASSSLIQHTKSGYDAALSSSDFSANNIVRTDVNKSTLVKPDISENNTFQHQSADFINKMAEQVQKLQDFADMNSWSVNFSIDEESGNTVIKVRDSDTQEVIRQVPSEEWLVMSQKIQDSFDSGDKKSISGLLFDNQV